MYKGTKRYKNDDAFLVVSSWGSYDTYHEVVACVFVGDNSIETETAAKKYARELDDYYRSLERHPLWNRSELEQQDWDDKWMDALAYAEDTCLEKNPFSYAAEPEKYNAWNEEFNKKQQQIAENKMKELWGVNELSWDTLMHQQALYDRHKYDEYNQSRVIKKSCYKV